MRELRGRNANCQKSLAPDNRLTPTCRADIMNFVISIFGSRWVCLALLLVPAALFSAAPVQKNPPVRPADADSPVLIWDVDPKLEKSLPRNFRTTDDPIRANKGQTRLDAGLADLHASGSGEFTADGLRLLLARTRGPVTVFDLRQETHIFVNGLPVSWFATNDWANVGRNQGAIEADESARVESLKVGSKIVVRPGAAVKKPGVSSGTPQTVTVDRASTERDIVGVNRLAYVRITVTDHARPLDDEVERAAPDVVPIKVCGQDDFTCEMWTGQHLPQRSDDRAPTAHQHGIRGIAKRHAHTGRKRLLA